MLESIWVTLAVSTVLGFLTGLGTGGGSLLILWLTMVLGLEQASARSINLMFFIPSAVIACVFRWRQGKLAFRKVLPAIIAGCASAFAFSQLGTRLDLDIIKKLFGALLIYTGIRELLYKPRERQ